MANPPDNGNNSGNNDNSTDSTSSGDPNVSVPAPPTSSPGWIWRPTLGAWYNTITHEFWRKPLGQDNSVDAPYLKVEYRGLEGDVAGPGKPKSQKCRDQVIDLYYYLMKGQAGYRPLSPLFDTNSIPPRNADLGSTSEQSFLEAWVQCLLPDGLGSTPYIECKTDWTECQTTDNNPNVKLSWECPPPSCDTWRTCDFCCGVRFQRDKLRTTALYDSLKQYLKSWFIGPNSLCSSIVNNLEEWKLALQKFDPYNPDNDMNNRSLPSPYFTDLNSLASPFAPPTLDNMGSGKFASWDMWWRGWKENIADNALQGDTDICQHFYDKLLIDRLENQMLEEAENIMRKETCNCDCKKCALLYGYCDNAKQSTCSQGSGSGGSGSCAESVGVSRFLSVKSISKVPVFFSATQPGVLTQYPYSFGWPIVIQGN